MKALYKWQGNNRLGIIINRNNENTKHIIYFLLIMNLFYFPSCTTHSACPYYLVFLLNMLHFLPTLP